MPGAEERRRLVRKAGLYAGGLFLAAVGVAVVGGGLLALLLVGMFGMSFWSAWLLTAAVLLGVPLAGHAVLALIDRFRRGR